jgi:polyhydroxyalkanoate synthesis regulator protein
MQGVVPQYLEAAMDAFKRNQKAMSEAFGGNIFADMAKRNMEMFQNTAQAFTTGPKKEAPASESEVDELRSELAKLQEKVDRLSK